MAVSWFVFVVEEVGIGVLVVIASSLVIAMLLSIVLPPSTKLEVWVVVSFAFLAVECDTDVFCVARGVVGKQCDSRLPELKQTVVWGNVSFV